MRVFRCSRCTLPVVNALCGCTAGLKKSDEPKQYPWWRKDRHGYPIEYVKGRWFSNLVRTVCQNLRKIPTDNDAMERRNEV